MLENSGTYFGLIYIRNQETVTDIEDIKKIFKKEYHNVLETVYPVLEELPKENIDEISVVSMLRNAFMFEIAINQQETIEKCFELLSEKLGSIPFRKTMSKDKFGISITVRKSSDKYLELYQ